MNAYGRKNSNLIKNKIEDSNSIIKLSGSRILSNSLNNKKYINTPQKSLEAIKSLKNNPNNRLLTISNENSSNYKKRPLYIKHKNDINITDISQYKSEKNILFDSINNKNSDLNKESNSKLYLKTDNNNSLDIEGGNNKREKFVFLHEIKKIKKKVDLSHRDKSIKSIMDNEIAFDEKNSQVALNPIKLLNNFQEYNGKGVHNKNNNLFSFMTEKAKISRKNVLIKLLLEKKDTYNKTINTRQRMLTEIKKSIDTDEKDFKTIIQNQKVSTRKIEDLLDKLLVRKKKLLMEYYYLIGEIRVKEDERQKILERINDYRIIAKFLTKALGGKAKLFDFKLTNIEGNSNINEYTYENETQKVLKRFSFFLNHDPNLCYINQDDIDIFNEITSLNYSDLLFHQFWKKEDSILKNLKRNELLNKEIVYFQEKEEDRIKYLKNKIEILEKELKYNQKIYLAEKKNFEKVVKIRQEKNTDFEEIIEDLYNFFFKHKKNKKNQKDSFSMEIETCVSRIQNAIIEKEGALNKLFFELDKDEKEDKALFDKVANNVKTENKLIHVSNMRKLGEQNKLKVMKVPKEKIILKYKRSEPPYYLLKKDKKIKVDPSLIKQLEDEELLAYD